MKKEALQKLFKSHPSVDEFHITSNDYAFKVKDHALDHARSLKDDKVHTVNRRDVFAPEMPNETKPERPTKAPKVAAEKPVKSKKAAEKTKPDQQPEKEATPEDKKG